MAADPPSEIESAKFSAYLNGAYHADREAYLDGRHRGLMFVIIVLGAGAVADALPVAARTAAAILTAMLAAADLVFDYSVKARTASFLRKRYFDVAAGLEDGALKATDAQAAMLRLAAEEEPPYKAAHAVAENWATGAVFGPTKPLPCEISLWRRLTRNSLHHASHDFTAGSPIQRKGTKTIS
jgi:hypothetical protein